MKENKNHVSLETKTPDISITTSPLTTLTASDLSIKDTSFFYKMVCLNKTNNKTLLSKLFEVNINQFFIMVTLIVSSVAGCGAAIYFNLDAAFPFIVMLCSLIMILVFMFIQALYNTKKDLYFVHENHIDERDWPVLHYVREYGKEGEFEALIKEITS